MRALFRHFPFRIFNERERSLSPLPTRPTGLHSSHSLRRVLFTPSFVEALACILAFLFSAPVATSQNLKVTQSVVGGVPPSAGQTFTVNISLEYTGITTANVVLSVLLNQGLTYQSFLGSGADCLPPDQYQMFVCTLSYPTNSLNITLTAPTTPDRFVLTTGAVMDVYEPLQTDNSSHLVIDTKSGDINGDRNDDIVDIFYLLNYIFAGGPPPLSNADVDCNGIVNVADVFYYLNYLYSGGPALRQCQQGPVHPPSGGTGSDAITLGQVVVTNGTTSNLHVPVYITDNSGTLLDNASATHSRIAGFVLKVQYGSTPGAPSQCATQDFSGGNDSTVPPFIRGGSLSTLYPNKFYSVTGTNLFNDSNTGSLTGDVDATIVFTRSDFDPTTPPMPGLQSGVATWVGDLVYDLHQCPYGTIPLHINSLAAADDSQLTNDSPNGPSGLVSEGHPQGLLVQDGWIAVQGLPLSVTSISPSIGPTSGGTTVTIYGSHFLAGASVTIGGVPATVTTVQSDHIVATTPAHAFGTANVVVTDVDQQTGSLTNAFAFDNAPTAALTASPASGLTPLQVVLSASASADPDTSAGDTLSYTFSFGDGSTPVTQVSPSINHTYAAAGTFSPTLVVTDSHGLSASASSSSIVVTAAVDGATFISQDVPTTMVKNHTYTLQFRLQNTGNTTWRYASYFLESQNPKDNTTFGAAQLGSCDNEAPGQICTWTINVTAPGTTGTYNIQRRMLHNSVTFGDTTPNVAVTVTNH